ncbi:MAG: hypothetical protein Q8P18_01930 [Pseudomonadota bacterium]|nr:hypothetical protein [Pseudomonadota bacterium]
MGRIALWLMATVGTAWAGYTKVPYPDIDLPQSVENGQPDELYGHPCVWAVGERGIREIKVSVKGKGWLYPYGDHEEGDPRGLHELDEPADGSRGHGFEVQDVTGFEGAFDFINPDPRLAVLVCTEIEQEIPVSFSPTCTTEYTCKKAAGQ